MRGVAKIPAVDGKETSFPDSEKQVQLRMRTTKTGPASRAPLLVLHMHLAPRQVCPSAGGYCLGNRDGVARVLDILGDYFAPEAADAIHQQVTRFTQYRRANQSIREFTVEINFSRREVGSKMEMGAGFPEQFAPIMPMNNAGLYRRGG